MVATLPRMDRTESSPAQALRALPSVDQLARLSLPEFPRALLVRAARGLVADLRQRVLAGALDAAELTALLQDGGAAALAERCRLAVTPRHRRVFNATGIVLHTGIGRSPLCLDAVEALTAAAGYAIVEVDPVTGERDQREVMVASLLIDITGAGGALVVNNNAAATTLMLAALCGGGEVVISRGELVEIGGGFRVPDVLRRAGCTMVEVGCTNRTHLRDFEGAITPATAALLKVHPSNFRIEGFAGTPDLAELAELAHGRSLLALEDLGSGMLCQDAIAGLEHEPRVHDSLATGADMVTFSGDKLLGGPQCGILLGRQDRIAAVRAHPLYRAFRCDKLTLAALEATLRVYRDGEPMRDIPTLRLLAATPAELQRRSERLVELLPSLGATVVASESFAGSGANPARALPSFAVALPGGAPLCDRLRAAAPIAVFARIAADRVLLDARTLLLEDLETVARAVRAALIA